MLGFHGDGVLQTNRLKQTQTSGIVVDIMDMHKTMKFMVILLLNRTPTYMKALQGMQITNLLNSSNKGDIYS
ncbi:hypothetical protein HN51_048299 [Arachis hypogaea]